MFASTLHKKHEVDVEQPSHHWPFVRTISRFPSILFLRRRPGHAYRQGCSLKMPLPPVGSRLYALGVAGILGDLMLACSLFSREQQVNVSYCGSHFLRA